MTVIGMIAMSMDDRLATADRDLPSIGRIAARAAALGDVAHVLETIDASMAGARGAVSRRGRCRSVIHV